MKVRTRKGLDRQTLENYFKAFQLTLSPSDYTHAEPTAGVSSHPFMPLKHDWGEAFDFSAFYGRTDELTI